MAGGGHATARLQGVEIDRLLPENDENQQDSCVFSMVFHAVLQPKIEITIGLEAPGCGGAG